MFGCVMTTACDAVGDGAARAMELSARTAVEVRFLSRDGLDVVHGRNGAE